MTISRILSLIVAGLYFLAAANPGQDAPWLLLFLLPVLSFIWLSEEWGGYKGPTARGLITSSSPASLVRLMGWFLLLLGLVVLIML